MRILKQSSTAQPLMFLLIQSADHISPLTGATPTVVLSKSGGGFGACAGTVTEVANGWYKVAGNATDTGTLGPLILHATATGADPRDVEFEIVAYDPQDAVHLGLTALPNTAVTTNASLLTSGAGTDQLSVTVGRIDIGKALGTAVTLDSNNVLNVSTKYLGGTLQTARDIGASVLLSSGTGSGQLNFTAGVVSANIAQILGSVVVTPATAGVLDVNVKNVNNIAAATPGAAGGLLISGSNAGTTTLAALTVTGATTLTGGLAGNQTGQSTKLPVTLNATDVTGNVPSDVQTIKTQALTAASGITFPSSIASIANQTSILAAVNAITTNTATGRMLLPTNGLLQPGSGSTGYEVDVQVFSLQGSLEDPDSNTITIHARNASGTSLDSGLGSTTMTRTAQGKYKVTYTVVSTDTLQEIFFDATWAVGTIPFAISASSAVVNTSGGAGVVLAATQPNYAPVLASVFDTFSTNVSLTLSNLGTAVGEPVTLPDVDGISGLSVMELLLSWLSGKTSVTDNGNGTHTINFYKQDGTTLKAAIIFNEFTGIRPATGSVS